MKHAHIICILCSSLVLSCANEAVPEKHLIINKDLSETYKKFDKSFNEERSPLSFNGGDSVSNCKSYFDMASKYKIDETIHNQLVKSEYLVCDALKILSNSSPGHAGPSSLSNVGKEVLSKLDLRSFPSSLYVVSDDKSHTLASLYPEQSSSNANIAQIDTKDWAFTLEVVAVARINNNAADDWIAWLYDESKSGNYRSYQTLIIYDAENQDSLKGVLYP